MQRVLLSEVFSNWNITAVRRHCRVGTHSDKKNLWTAHIGERPSSLNSITTAPIHNPQETTVHRMLISTPLSPNPHRNLLPLDNALFPIWKKERKSISGFNTWGSRSILPGSFFLSASLSLFLLFPPSLANGKQKQWCMVIVRSGWSQGIE